MYAAGCFARPGYEYRARAMEWNGDDVIGMGVNGGSVYDGYAVRNTNNLKFFDNPTGWFYTGIRCCLRYFETVC